MSARVVGGCLAVAGVAGLTLVVSKPQEVVVSRYATAFNERTKSQRHNAELALDRLNGAIIPPGETFSFNKRVGSFSRDQGYRKAPVSYNGQVVDSWGGGVCQTSTTLYNAALLAGLDVVERNRHHFAPTYVPPGRDAAVAFNTIDLKLRNPYSFPIRIEAVERDDRVEIQMLAPKELPIRPEVVARITQVHSPSVFLIGEGTQLRRVRNSGTAGYDVTVYRIEGDRKELISSDHYPPMNRIIEQQ